MTWLLPILLATWLGAVQTYGLVDRFDDSALEGWRQPDGAGWRVDYGSLRSPGTGGVGGMLLHQGSARNLRIQVDLLLPEAGRRNVSVGFRLRPEGTGYVVRWYDQAQWLELIRYQGGQVVRHGSEHWLATSPQGSARQEPGRWFTLKAEVDGSSLRAKVWPRGGTEPGWLLEAECPDTAAGSFGLGADQTTAMFDNFMVVADERLLDRQQEESRRREENDLSVRLKDGLVLHYGEVGAVFRVSEDLPDQAPELLFRARGAGAYLYARAARDGLELGRVAGGQDSVLVRSRGRWYAGPGSYRLRVRVDPSQHDERGAAWFINRQHVPPLLSVRAELAALDGDPGGALSAQALADPIEPGNVGDPYWHLDPFSSGDARMLLGAGVGWRKVAGVEWQAVEAQPRVLEDAAVRVIHPAFTIRTGDRGGCWLALGDLDGDRRLDFLVARNNQQAVTALTAYDNSGRELWRWGEGGGANIAYDVPAVIYDIDRDGRADVLVGIRGFLLVLDGLTGWEKQRWPLPPGLEVADCIIIANLRGLKAPADIIVKTRYDDAWAFTNSWQPLWEFHGNTGHHPDVRDIDGDGRDEVLCGYTLLDHDGSLSWQHDLPAHADAARLVEEEPGGAVRALNTCCGGNDMVMSELGGEIMWQQRPAVEDFHFQSVHLGELRPDIPGYEIVSDEGWARPGRGRLALLTAWGEWLGSTAWGEWLGSYYVSYPRFQRLMDWEGDGVMELVIPSDGVLVDGQGRLRVRLASAPLLDGPGEMSPMAFVADLLGDGRDELVLLNARRIVVYANPDPPHAELASKPVVMRRYYNATYY
jgi:hypothetical protein